MMCWPCARQCRRQLITARSGGGPSLIVNNTYRYRGHSKSDRNRYRTQEEIEEWQRNDPILRFRELLVAEDLVRGRRNGRY